MDRFVDRQDGGQKLAQLLGQYVDKPNTIVIGLPRGGVVTAFEVAKILNLPLDIIVTRKIGAPFQPELAVGAMAQDGTVLFNEQLALLGLTEEQLEPIIQEERKELKRRVQLYRPDRGPLDLTNKTVIIVDDGIATGATTRAAIESARTLGAKKIVVATPVAPPEIAEQLTKEVDEYVCLASPALFGAVGQFYEQFPQTEDQEVTSLLKEAK